MIATPAPTSQKAGVRPISFLLDNAGAIGEPVNMVIRPEDLTRSETLRSSVHQTLGRETAGWVDHFGRGLPTVTIAGHTGWRHALGSGMDGAESFERLNSLLMHEFPQAKQDAIDAGTDPALVKLLFIDTLDGFAYSVVPQPFVLRRSKSRPLLYQYSITMQVVEDTVEGAFPVAPFVGNVSAALTGMDSAIDFFRGSWGASPTGLSSALSGINGAPIGFVGSMTSFLGLTGSALSLIRSNITGAASLATSRVGRIVYLGQVLSLAGANVFHAVNLLSGLGGQGRAAIAEVASSYNEVMCLLNNALRARQVYEDYTPLYGSSNCSSTTGGRPASELLEINVFAEMAADASLPVTLNGDAVDAFRRLIAMDPVLAPMSLSEIARLVDVIVQGVSL